MSLTARVVANLNILNANGQLIYQSQPTSLTITPALDLGPTPGMISCSTAGTDINLSQLTTAGVCRIFNKDPTNFVTVGMWDGTHFHPLMEIRAGEFWIFRLSRELGNEYGTGTSVTSAADTLRIKADTAACEVVVDAFNA